MNITSYLQYLLPGFMKYFFYFYFSGNPSPEKFVAETGVEPVTSGLWILRSNHLSYPASHPQKLQYWIDLFVFGGANILFIYIETNHFLFLSFVLFKMLLIVKSSVISITYILVICGSNARFFMKLFFHFLFYKRFFLYWLQFKLCLWHKRNPVKQ